MPVHGRYSTYINHGCRCPDCRAANARYQREARRRRKAALEQSIQTAPDRPESPYSDSTPPVDELSHSEILRVSERVDDHPFAFHAGWSECSRWFHEYNRSSVRTHEHPDGPNVELQQRLNREAKRYYGIDFEWATYPTRVALAATFKAYLSVLPCDTPSDYRVARDEAAAFIREWVRGTNGHDLEEIRQLLFNFGSDDHLDRREIVNLRYAYANALVNGADAEAQQVRNHALMEFHIDFSDEPDMLGHTAVLDALPVYAYYRGLNLDTKAAELLDEIWDAYSVDISDYYVGS